MKKIKNLKLIVPFILYLATWIICGIIYWIMACSSCGEMFLFQEDILLKSKIVSFEKEAEVNVNYGLVKPLIQDYVDESYIGMTSGNYPMLRYAFNENGYKMIGMNWMRYYYAQWSQEGYNFYKCEYIEPADIYSTKNVQVIKLTICSIPDSTYNKISQSQYLTLPLAYESKILKSKEYYATFDGELLEKFDYNKFYPLYEDLYFLSNTYNYLDDSILIIDKYINQDGFIYSPMDFLYFSAVTITTLGYGDILPNSTAVRIVVMTETLLGMILIAILASAVYDYFKNIKNKDLIT